MKFSTFMMSRPETNGRKERVNYQLTQFLMVAKNISRTYTLSFSELILEERGGDGMVGEATWGPRPGPIV